MFKSRQKVLVVGGSTSYHRPYHFLYEAETDHVQLYKKPNKFGLVLFTGGEDVSPNFYKDASSSKMTHSNEDRDNFEHNVFKFAVKNSIPMAGICRGLQFLNVMAGGRLLHDIMGHSQNGGYHDMETYSGTYRVNSLHHQACVPAPKSYVIGWSPQGSNLRVYGNHDRHLKYWPAPIVEAMIFPEICAYGVQYHPEMMQNTELAVQWFIELATDFSDTRSMSSIVNKWTHKKLYNTSKVENKTAAHATT